MAHVEIAILATEKMSLAPVGDARNDESLVPCFKAMLGAIKPIHRNLNLPDSAFSRDASRSTIVNQASRG
jgi:hypothetical protein